jgi:fructose-1,6-bisphosphatase/inositol monophosphatase family enzyme
MRCVAGDGKIRLDIMIIPGIWTIGPGYMVPSQASLPQQSRRTWDMDGCDGLGMMSCNVAALMRDVASREIMPRFRNLAPGDSREKGPDDWVTVADEAAERALRAGLLALLPQAVTVGEEEVAADPCVMHRLSGESPVWIIDPVDGTRLFRDGEEGFGVIVALVVEGRTRMGWILDCCSGFLAYTEQGAGTRELRADQSRHPVAASAESIPSEGRANWPFFAGDVSSRRLHPPGAPSATLSRCSTIDYLSLAGGTSAFTVTTHSAPWDHAAGALMVCEMGGVALRHDGSPYSPARAAEGMLVARNAQVASSVRDAYLPLLASAS